MNRLGPMAPDRHPHTLLTYVQSELTRIAYCKASCRHRITTYSTDDPQLSSSLRVFIATAFFSPGCTEYGVPPRLPPPPSGAEPGPGHGRMSPVATLLLAPAEVWNLLWNAPCSYWLFHVPPGVFLCIHSVLSLRSLADAECITLCTILHILT